MLESVFFANISRSSSDARRPVPCAALLIRATTSPGPETLEVLSLPRTPTIHARRSRRQPGRVRHEWSVATASMVVNSIPLVLHVKPGLHTMLDMPLPHYYGG